MIQVIGRICIAVLLLLALLIGGIIASISTNKGSQLLWPVAQSFVGDQISLGELSGALTSPFTLSNINVNNDAMSLQIDRVEINWSLSKLFERKLDINQLTVSGVDYQALKTEAKSEQPSFDLTALSLPVAVEIRNARLSDLNFISSPKAAPITIDYLDAALTLNDNEIVLHSATLASQQADVNAKLQIDLQTLETKGTLLWEVRLPEYSAFKGDAQVSGLVDQLEISWNAQPPYKMAGLASITNALAKPVADVVINNIDLTLSEIQNDLPDAQIKGLLKVQSDIGTSKTGFQSALALTNLPEIGAVKTAISGSLENDLVVIDQWRITPNNLETQIDAKGQIVLNDDKEMELIVGWQNLQWPFNDQPVFTSPAGQSTISGSLSNLVIRLTSNVTSPLVTDQISGDIQLDLTTTKPTIDGRVSIPNLSYPNTNKPIIDRAEVSLTVKGQLPLLVGNFALTQKQSGTLRSITTTTNIDLTAPDQPSLDMAGKWQNLQWPLSTASETQVQVSSKQGTFSITGNTTALAAKFAAAVNDNGQITANVVYSPDEINASADWKNLDYQNTDGHFQSDKGTLTVQGTPDEFSLSVDSHAMVDDKSMRLFAEGNGNRTSIDLHRMSASLLDGEVSGTAKVDWSPTLSAEVDLISKAINPAIWWPEWPGQIDGKIKAEARVNESILLVDGLSMTLNGQLRDYPINASLTASKTASALNIDSLTLQSAQTKLNAKGKYADTLELSWGMDSTDLRSLHPLASGNLKSKGTLRGSPDRPIIEAELTGQNVQFDNNVLNSINANLKIDSTDNTTSTVDVMLSGRIADIDITNASINTEGLTTNHQIKLTANTSKGNIAAALNSKLKSFTEWEFDLNQTQFDVMDFGRWILTKPASGAYNKQGFLISSSCFSSNQSTVCLDGKQQDGKLETSIELDNLALTTLLSPFTSDFTVEGAISGRGKLTKSENKDPVGTFNVTTTAGKIQNSSIDATPGTAQLLVFEPGKLSLQLNQGKATALFNLPLAGNDFLKANATLTGQSVNWAERAVTADINASIANIKFLERLIPGADNLAGSINGAMTVKGSISKPTFQGTLSLANGAVELSAAEIRLENVSLTLEGDPQAGMNLSGTATSGGGQLSLSGQVDLSKGVPVADIVLKGERAQVMNTAIAEVYVSPDLRLKLNDKKIDLTGELVIPAANITVKSIPQSAIKASSDQVIVVEEEEEEEAVAPGPYQITANINTRLGDAVNFSGFGLTGRLGGELTSIETPGKPSLIKGEINVIDGRYEAYGQNLDIETGRLLFAGNGATNPALDLRATRQPTEDIKVGVTARGKLQEPEFTLYSSPSMTDRNKLSYLILGRAPDQTSSGEKSQLGQLALALGLKRSSGITSAIGNTFGIDKIGVEAEPGSDAEQESFVIGKYLTPKLYLRYGIGLFEPINTLRLQYSIDEHWKIVTESSDKASSGDIQYSVDR